MKKLFFASLFTLIGLVGYSQASVAVGIKGGLNFSNIDVSQSAGVNYNNRTGYHFGAFTLLKFGKIGLQPEILFSRQGSQYKIVATDFEANFDYINIPIILKLYTIAGINIQVGPQIGFLSSAQAKETIGGITTTTDVKSLIKSNDFSLALGLGWDLPFGLTIDARYNLGLSKINDSVGSLDTRNQVIQVSAGYKLFKFGN
jgi:hypothetical protein